MATQQQRDVTKAAHEEFDRAAAYELRFGKKYAGKTLREIGDEDEGLLYLDWLLGRDWLRDPAKKHIITFLNFEPIARRINALLDQPKNNDRQQPR